MTESGNVAARRPGSTAPRWYAAQASTIPPSDAATDSGASQPGPWGTPPPAVASLRPTTTVSAARTQSGPRIVQGGSCGWPAAGARPKNVTKTTRNI